MCRASKEGKKTKTGSNTTKGVHRKPTTKIRQEVKTETKGDTGKMQRNHSSVK